MTFCRVQFKLVVLEKKFWIPAHFQSYLAWPAGKGVLGWVAVGPEISRSPIKGKEGPRDVKVILGNKQMMADEGIPISKAVDDYMRDMEVCL